MSTDERFMRRAISLAVKAKGMTSPNPLVGAVIVKKGRIIAEGWHRRCGSDHAEIVALKQLNFHASGAKMYVTLEPCFHYGKTPPCVDSVIKSGIREVVIGMKDPNRLTNGRSVAKLRRAKIKVNIGILENECRSINEPFIKYMKTRMPFVVAKSAQTLDGKVAASSGQSQWITSEKTRRLSHRARDEFDAIMVGINTVLKDDPRLNGVRKGRSLRKIIVDSGLRVPLKAKLFRGVPGHRCIIATTKKANPAKVERLQALGVEILVAPAKNKRVDLKWLMRELARREITNILLEGGAMLIGNALKEDLVDQMHIYIAPKIMGDEAALSAVAGLKVIKVSQALQLKDITVKNINGDLLVKAYVHRHR